MSGGPGQYVSTTVEIAFVLFCLISSILGFAILAIIYEYPIIDGNWTARLIGVTAAAVLSGLAAIYYILNKLAYGLIYEPIINRVRNDLTVTYGQDPSTDSASSSDDTQGDEFQSETVRDNVISGLEAMGYSVTSTQHESDQGNDS